MVVVEHYHLKVKDYKRMKILTVEAKVYHKMVEHYDVQAVASLE